MGLTFDVATISILVVLGGIIVSGFIYLIALINTAPMVFFQSYVLHFIGSRYPAVGTVLFPPPADTSPPTLEVRRSSICPRVRACGLTLQHGPLLLGSAVLLGVNHKSDA